MLRQLNLQLLYLFPSTNNKLHTNTFSYICTKNKHLLFSDEYERTVCLFENCVFNQSKHVFNNCLKN